MSSWGPPVRPTAVQDSAAARKALPAGERAPAQARTFVRAVIAGRALGIGSAGAVTERLADTAALLTSELVTNAFVHAGTGIEIACLPEGGEAADSPGLTGVTVEVTDSQPTSSVPREQPAGGEDRGFGLRIVHALAESWGVTYRRTCKSVWFRVTAAPDEYGPVAGADPESLLREPVVREMAVREERRAPREFLQGRRGAFLAEVSELLAGQLDEDMVAALAGQLLVPRLADWCAVWLTAAPARMRLSRVWHVDEHRIGPLRNALQGESPLTGASPAGTPWPWPQAAGDGGSALAFPLVAGGVSQGVLVIGVGEPHEITDHVARAVEDMARRVAQALVTARMYTRQTTISRTLQRKQLPPSLASIPGVESAIVYEPHARGQTVGGDFYDLFPLGDDRWCFLLGDVQGKDAEAMSVTGLTRHLVRLLARDGRGVESVLGRLNGAMAEEGAESAALGEDAAGPRFLSLVYGELTPDVRHGGAHCTLASAGHPPPLHLSAAGTVTPAGRPQLLLGIDEDAEFTADSFFLAPGETLLCVTDGVTERRAGDRQLDDDDGLARILRSCTAMGAMAVAERIRRVTHDFSSEPVGDDLAILALHASPRSDSATGPGPNGSGPGG
ncbi:SpoIIE family protein phosphatase [Streptomyces sp. TR06-5]|uniref:SpoIIE family protein phosphatase n=1 Tax=unclassified Streptomyces TaxID=2593676 RepID=UPI0039A3C456